MEVFVFYEGRNTPGTDRAKVTKEQLAKLIKLEKVGIVTLYRDKCEEMDGGKIAWAVWAETYDDRETLVMVAGRGPSKGKTRHYTSLDRAHSAIREMGFRWLINIDG